MGGDHEFHQAYDIRGEKRVPNEDDCFDLVRAKVHTKDEMEALMKAFRGMGFALKVTRSTDVDTVNEKFPSEEDGGGPGEDP